MVSVAAFLDGVDRTMRIFEGMARVEQRRRKEVMINAEAVSALVDEPEEGGAFVGHTVDGAVERNEQAAQVEVSIDEADKRQPLIHHSAQLPQSLLASFLRCSLNLPLALLSVFRSLLISSHSVQMSLSRQSRLLTEALSEPILFFTNFPTDTYQQLVITQRRIWQLVLTIQSTLEHILQQQKHSLIHPTSQLVREELFHVSAVGGDMRRMMDEVIHLLRRCGTGLQQGRLVGEVHVDQVVRSVHGIERQFVEQLNQISQRVRSGQAKMLSSRAIVLIAVFFHSAVQLAEQVLIFNASVCRLLELERPKSYDD